MDSPGHLWACDWLLPGITIGLVSLDRIKFMVHSSYSFGGLIFIRLWGLQPNEARFRLFPASPAFALLDNSYLLKNIRVREGGKQLF